MCLMRIVLNQVLQHRGLFYYYVYNPTTSQVATINIIWDQLTTIHASVLDFDPSKSPHCFTIDLSVTQQGTDFLRILSRYTWAGI